MNSLVENTLDICWIVGNLQLMIQPFAGGIRFKVPRIFWAHQNTCCNYLLCCKRHLGDPIISMTAIIRGMPTISGSVVLVSKNPGWSNCQPFVPLEDCCLMVCQILHGHSPLG